MKLRSLEALRDIPVIWCLLLLPRETNEAESSLRLVNILFRHGDRTPMQSLPGSDIYSESDWPQGYAQLTTRGIQQEYKLGLFLRDRYDGFLSRRYSPKEIYVESTNRERTLMSGQTVTAALYMPEGAQKWHPEINWQPIPLHPASWVQHDSTNCDSNELKERIFKELRGKYKEVFDTIEAGMNRPVVGVGMVWQVFDTLFCQEQHNKTWPGWVSQELMRLLEQEVLPNYFGQYYIHEKNRADLLDKMLNEMDVYVTNTHSSEMKAFLYSGHDTNILCMLSALNTYNQKMVPYSTAVLVELHYGNITVTRADTGWGGGVLGEDRGEEEGTENDEDIDAGAVKIEPQWFVQIWLRNDSTRGPYKLTIPGCSSDCPWENFIELTSKSITDFHHHQASCHLQKIRISTHLWEAILGMLGVGGFFMISMAMVSLICLYKHRKRRQRLQAILYRQLNTEDIPMSDTG